MKHFKYGKIIFIVAILLISLSFIVNSQFQDEFQIRNPYSSADDFFIQLKASCLVRKPCSGPIKIGTTIQEVQNTMGFPDYVDTKNHIYFYRYSPIYFDQNWKVQSWNNRYGNLVVIPEKLEVRLGSHLSEVFQEKGLPLRILKLSQYFGYQLEYPDEMIYIGNEWKVESIQHKKRDEQYQGKTGWSTEDYLREYQDSFFMQSK